MANRLALLVLTVAFLPYLLGVAIVGGAGGGSGNPSQVLFFNFDNGVAGFDGGAGYDINNTCAYAGRWGNEVTTSLRQPNTRQTSVSNLTIEQMHMLGPGTWEAKELCYHNMNGGSLGAGSTVLMTLQEVQHTGGSGILQNAVTTLTADDTNSVNPQTGNCDTAVDQPLTTSTQGGLRLCVLSGDADDVQDNNRTRYIISLLVERTAAP